MIAPLIVNIVAKSCNVYFYQPLNIKDNSHG